MMAVTRFCPVTLEAVGVDTQEPEQEGKMKSDTYVVTDNIY